MEARGHDLTAQVAVEPRRAAIFHVARGRAVRRRHGRVEPVTSQQPREESGSPYVSATGGVAAARRLVERNLGAERRSGGGELASRGGPAARIPARTGPRDVGGAPRT